MKRGFLPVILTVVGLFIVAGIAIGAFWFGKSYSSKTSTSSALVNTTSKTTPDETASWKTFNFKSFQIKYPTDWEAIVRNPNDTREGVELVPPEMISDVKKTLSSDGGCIPHGSVTIYEVPDSNYINTYFKTTAAVTVTKKPVVVNGINATEYTSIWNGGGPCKGISDKSISTIVSGSGKMFEVGLTNFDNRDYTDKYYQILSTFKSTN